MKKLLALLLLSATATASAQWLKVTPDASVIDSFNFLAKSDFGAECKAGTYNGKYSFELANDFPSDQAALMYIFGMQMSSTLDSGVKLSGHKVTYFNYNMLDNFISLAYSPFSGDTKSYVNFQYRSDTTKPFFLIQNCVVSLPDPK